MTKFDDYREKLNKIEGLVAQGRFEEVNTLMTELSANASLFIIFGPNDSLQRFDGSETRDIPDEGDLNYYLDTFTHINYAEFFNNADWGIARLTYEAINLEGVIYPAIKVNWDDRNAFASAAGTEEFNTKIDAILSLLTVVLGSRWHKWQVQVV